MRQENPFTYEEKTEFIDSMIFDLATEHAFIPDSPRIRRPVFKGCEIDKNSGEYSGILVDLRTGTIEEAIYRPTKRGKKRLEIVPKGFFFKNIATLNETLARRRISSRGTSKLVELLDLASDAMDEHEEYRKNPKFHE